MRKLLMLLAAMAMVALTPTAAASRTTGKNYATHHQTKKEHEHRYRDHDRRHNDEWVAPTPPDLKLPLIQITSEPPEPEPSMFDDAFSNFTSPFDEAFSYFHGWEVPQTYVVRVSVDRKWLQ